MTGCTAVVTGARRVGLTVCRALLDQGNQVVAVDVDCEELERQAEEKLPPFGLGLVA
jgi:Trk K+ transport system NAD-binding subunit